MYRSEITVASLFTLRTLISPMIVEIIATAPSKVTGKSRATFTEIRRFLNGFLNVKGREILPFFILCFFGLFIFLTDLSFFTLGAFTFFSFFTFGTLGAFSFFFFGSLGTFIFFSFISLAPLLLGTCSNSLYKVV